MLSFPALTSFQVRLFHAKNVSIRDVSPHGVPYCAVHPERVETVSILPTW